MSQVAVLWLSEWKPRQLHVSLISAPVEGLMSAQPDRLFHSLLAQHLPLGLVKGLVAGNDCNSYQSNGLTMHYSLPWMHWTCWYPQPLANRSSYDTSLSQAISHNPLTVSQPTDQDCVTVYPWRVNECTLCPWWGVGMSVAWQRCTCSCVSVVYILAGCPVLLMRGEQIYLLPYACEGPVVISSIMLTFYFL